MGYNSSKGMSSRTSTRPNGVCEKQHSDYLCIKRKKVGYEEIPAEANL